MCTLSFIPTADGYLVGMNRDELLTRPVARPPETFKRARMQAVYPSEPAGGTWIACNSRGVLLALLNWNDAARKTLSEKTQSRGLLVPKLIWQTNSNNADSQLARIQLDGMLPFRLIGIFRQEQRLFEWRSDGGRAERTEHPWMRQHWFSSS